MPPLSSLIRRLRADRTPGRGFPPPTPPPFRATPRYGSVGMEVGGGTPLFRGADASHSPGAGEARYAPFRFRSTALRDRRLLPAASRHPCRSGSDT